MLVNLFLKKTVKIGIPGGKPEFVLKGWSHLIIAEISKTFFYFFEIFFGPPGFLSQFF